MEDMGQMGNADEAILPDDVPFSMDDLELEDDPVEMQAGGFTPGKIVGLPLVFNPQPIFGLFCAIMPTFSSAAAQLDAQTSRSTNYGPRLCSKVSRLY